MSTTCAGRPRPVWVGLAGGLLLLSCADRPPMPRIRPAPAVAGLAAAPARALYVDPDIGEAGCTDYRPNERRCGTGSETAFQDLAAGADAARPGDTVVIRQATLDTPLVPTRSGGPGAPVTFRGYPGERVTLRGIDAPALQIRDRAHIVVEGLVVEDVLGWGRIQDSTDIVLRKNRFVRATARGTTGGLKLVRSHWTRVAGNVFEAGNDSLVLQESDHNVIEDNTFVRARHSLLSVRCGSFNVIRNNRFSNPDQKAAEIYDCEAVSDAPYRLDATRRNLFEGNTFAQTRESSRHYRYNAIQYAGQQGIVRRNVFHDNLGGGLGLALYPDEALYNYGHRIYRNTFYANRCYGLSAGAGPGRRFADNVAKGNLFFRNGDCAGAPTQFLLPSRSAVRLLDNAVLLPGDDPRFVNESARDLHLQPGSPLVDGGAFLTTTTTAGTGVVMRVEDVWYFYDGYGIESEPGDTIQLAGTASRAVVVKVDYTAGALVLDRALTWHAGQGVALSYEGRAPDPGAFEVR